MRAAVTVSGQTFRRAGRDQSADDRHPSDRMLEVRDLHKTVAVGFRRRKVEILKGVDLEVRDGDVFGLLGPNGAGKTTTLKVVLGLMRPTSGSVTLGVHGLAELGYLPENPYFYDYLTGARVPALLRPPVLARRPGARRARRRHPGRRGPGARRRGAAAQVLQGHAAAHRHRPGAHQRSPLRAPRRAHDRPRPHRPGRGQGDHPAAPRARHDGALQLAHPGRRRGPVHAHRHHARRSSASGRARSTRPWRRARQPTSRASSWRWCGRDAGRGRRRQHLPRDHPRPHPRRDHPVRAGDDRGQPVAGQHQPGCSRTA